MRLITFSAAIAIGMLCVANAHAQKWKHLVFATSSLHGPSTVDSVPPYYPSFGSAEGADWIATFAAYNAGLLLDWNGIDGVWKAILSTDSVSARNRIAIKGPVYNKFGELVANNEADFFDGSLSAPIRWDEFGNDIGSDWVWTGSTGLGQSDLTASNWSSPSDTSFATVGFSSATDARFLKDDVRSGDLFARLYVLSPPIPTGNVPEPSTLAIMLAGLAACGLRRARAVSRRE